MSFHASASNIRVDDGHMLRAVLQNGNGESVEAEYNLNDAIGNNNGRFEWSSSSTSSIFLWLADRHSSSLTASSISKCRLLRTVRWQFPTPHSRAGDMLAIWP